MSRPARFSVLLLVALFAASCSSAENEPSERGLQIAPATEPADTATEPPVEIAETPSPESATHEATATPAATPAPSAEPPPSVLLTAPAGVPEFVSDDGLATEIESYLGGDSGVSVVVKNLGDGRGVALNAGQAYYTASLFKIFVMYEVFNQRALGNLSFDEELEVTQEWIDLSLGDSVYTTPGQVVSISEALEAMITLSDNVTANILADRAGWDNIRSSMAGLGLSSTVLGGGELTSTAADVAHFLEVLYAGAGVDADASNEMLNLLSRQQIRDRIPKYLPAGTRVANKTGSWDNVTHDAGIVYGPSGAYLVVVMTGRGSAHETIAEVSRIVYAYFNP
ncbi:MAG: serine hydrolase [Dehalococcoidia bacterium]